MGIPRDYHPENFSLKSVQSLSRVRLFATPWPVAHQASLSITNSQSLLKLMSIELVMPSNHLILCRPLLLLPSIFPSVRVFSSESVLRIRWPKYWSFSFSISPSNEYSGLISFRMHWLDLLAVQGTLKSLQHHSNTTATPQQLCLKGCVQKASFKEPVLLPWRAVGGCTHVLCAEGQTVVFWQGQLPSPTRLSIEEQRPGCDQDAQNWGGAWQLRGSMALLCAGTGLGGKKLAN